MKFNRCVRCGAFFASEDNVCPNCKNKDKVDMSTIKNYISQNDLPKNVEILASQSGVSVKNINRFLEMKEFSSLKNSFQKQNIEKSKKNIEL